MSRVLLKMRFFHDGCVNFVLESSCIFNTLRFSVQNFLALIAMDGMYAGFAGAKTCHRKSLFLGALYRVFIRNLFLSVPSVLAGTVALLTLGAQIPIAQAAEIRDPMEPPAFALQKFREAKWKKNANRVVKKKTVVKKAAVKPMRLTSILFSPERKVAIIDDQTLKVGDVIRNAKLIKINKHNVRLMKKGKIIDLVLNDDLTAIKKISVESKL